MSESTIARWNAIPMSRQDPAPSQGNLKRSRSPDDDDDDDISIASRTPSPEPEAMDVDKYDEYHRGFVREVITVDTKIRPENKGFSLLAKMGWVEGQPLGMSGDGRVDPIPFQLKNDCTGIGKATRDIEMIETTVSQRRDLDSERQQKETEEQRRLREDAVTRKAALTTEISQTLKAFFCSLCDKQFQTVAQYDEHTNSYAHHHKARLKDMNANARPVSKDELERRKEKERRREEKELRKIAAAAGIKMPKAPAPPLAASTSTGSSASLAPVSAPSTVKKSGWSTLASSGAGPNKFAPVATAQEPKRGGWASVSGTTAPAPPQPPPQGGPRNSGSGGWATVGSSSTAPAPPPPPSSIAPPPPPPDAAPPPPPSSFSASPGFRTAGWTSLDTTSSSPNPQASSRPPPPPPPPHEHPHPHPPPTGRSNWQQQSANVGSNWQRPAGLNTTTPVSNWQERTQQQQQPAPPQPPAPTPPQSTPTPAPAPVRTGWQQFNSSMKGGRGRR